jgi:hypothetical protein
MRGRAPLVFDAIDPTSSAAGETNLRGLFAFLQVHK